VQATLRETISLLLLLLLDERGLVNYEEGSTLMKAINVLMLKVGGGWVRPECISPATL
jgi:hypothetical protein